MKEIKRWIAGALLCARLLSDTAVPVAFAAQTGEDPVDGVFAEEITAEPADTTVDGVLSENQTAEEVSTEQIQNLNVEVSTQSVSPAYGINLNTNYVILDGKPYSFAIYIGKTNSFFANSGETPIHYYNGETISYAVKVGNDDIDDNINKLGDFYTVQSANAFDEDQKTYINSTSATLSEDKRTVTGTIKTLTPNNTRIIRFYVPVYFGGKISTDTRYNIEVHLAYDAVCPTVVATADSIGTITAKGFDTLSGVDRYYFSTSNTRPAANAAGWQTDNTYTPNGAGTYYVWAQDRAGNVSEEAAVVKVSTPETHIVLDGKVYSTFCVLQNYTGKYDAKPVYHYYNSESITYSAYVNDNTNAAYANWSDFYTVGNACGNDGDSTAGFVTSTDAVIGSGNRSVSGTIKTLSPRNNRITSFYIPVNYGGKAWPDYQYRYSYEVYLVYDDVAPRVSARASSDGIITATGYDDNSGIEGYFFSLNSYRPSADDTGWQESNVYVASHMGTYSVWAKDRAGNISNYCTVKVGNQEKAARVVIDGKTYTPALCIHVHPDTGLYTYYSKSNDIHWYNGDSITAYWYFGKGVDVMNYGELCYCQDFSGNDGDNGSSSYTTAKLSSLDMSTFKAVGTIPTISSIGTRIKMIYLPIFYGGANNAYRYNLELQVCYDGDAPTIKSVTVDEKNSTLTVTATDSTSGIGGYYFSNTQTTAPAADDAGWQTSNIYPAAKDGTYNIWVKDLAGNVSAMVSKTISNTTPVSLIINGDSVPAICYLQSDYSQWSGTKSYYFYNTEELNYAITIDPNSSKVNFKNFSDYYGMSAMAKATTSDTSEYWTDVGAEYVNSVVVKGLQHTSGTIKTSKNGKRIYWLFFAEQGK